MSGWQWFWALVGYIVYIVVLIFAYFYKPFEDLFTLVLNDVGYDNAIYWVVLVTGIVGLQLLGYTGWVSDVFYGAALIVAVLASTVTRRRTLRA